MSMNMLSMHDRIFRRSGHLAVTHRHYLLVWGGYMERLVSNEDHAPNSQEYHYPDEVWAFNCNTEIWERWLTSGDVPPSLCGSCGLVLGDWLYVFGGYCNANSCNVNWLRRLDLTTLVWHELNPSGQHPAPCDKLAGWTYENKLYFFGGFGPAPTFPASFQHVTDPSTIYHGARGWNNQLVVYNPASNAWEWPVVGGVPPSPRAAHAADISGDKVYVFGGRFEKVRNNHLFCLDLVKMRWSPNLTDESSDVPEGRSWHSFNFISPERAVVYGGFSNENRVRNDCWVFSSVTHSWSEFHLRYDLGEPRCWHATCVSPIGQLIIHSGVTQPYYESRLKLEDHAEEMLMLDFSPRTLFRLSMDAVLSKVPRAHWMGEPNGVSCLPKTLEKILRSRFEQAYTLPPLSLTDQSHPS